MVGHFWWARQGSNLRTFAGKSYYKEPVKRPPDRPPRASGRRVPHTVRPVRHTTLEPLLFGTECPVL